MKKLIFSFFLCSGIVHAEALNVSVKNFKFDYHAPSGQGSAAEFSYGAETHKDVTVSVDKLETSFKFQVTGIEASDYEFKNAPAFLTSAETMSVAGLTVALDQSFALSLGSGVFASPKNTLELNGLNVTCNRGAEDEPLDQLFSGCSQNMIFKSSKFTSEGMEEALSAVMAEAIKVTSVDLKVSSGKYNLSADVKASVSGKVKSTGSLSYDATKSVLTLKITEVKFSILNITSKVFDELEKKESEKFKVSRPYVYITVK